MISLSSFSKSNAVLYTCMFRIDFCCCDCILINIIRSDLHNVLFCRFTAQSRYGFQFFPRSPVPFNGAGLLLPGGSRAMIAAPSIAMVPDPQYGSQKDAPYIPRKIQDLPMKLHPAMVAKASDSSLGPIHRQCKCQIISQRCFVRVLSITSHMHWFCSCNKRYLNCVSFYANQEPNRCFLL